MWIITKIAAEIWVFGVSGKEDVRSEFAERSEEERKKSEDEHPAAEM